MATQPRAGGAHAICDTPGQLRPSVGPRVVRYASPCAERVRRDAPFSPLVRRLLLREDVHAAAFRAVSGSTGVNPLARPYGVVGESAVARDPLRTLLSRGRLAPPFVAQSGATATQSHAQLHWHAVYIAWHAPPTRLLENQWPWHGDIAARFVTQGSPTGLYPQHDVGMSDAHYPIAPLPSSVRHAWRCVRSLKGRAGYSTLG